MNPDDTIETMSTIPAPPPTDPDDTAPHTIPDFAGFASDDLDSD